MELSSQPGGSHPPHPRASQPPCLVVMREASQDAQGLLQLLHQILRPVRPHCPERAWDLPPLEEMSRGDLAYRQPRQGAAVVISFSHIPWVIFKPGSSLVYF